MNITFTNPEFLWLLLSIPLLIISHFFVQKNLKTTSWKFANFEAIQRITEGKQTLRNAIKLNRNILLLLLRLLILALLIFAAAGTILWYYGASQNTNFVLAIDSSSSMLAQDFAPNRFEAAKNAAVEFADTMSGSGNIGVIAFSGASEVVQDLGKDKYTTEESIKNLKLQPVGGTDIGQAIVASTNMLSSGFAAQNQPKPGTIILLTDGRSTTGMTIEDATAYAKKNSITIYTIGIATTAGGTFGNGANLLSTIDEESLKYIAGNTGGKYYRAADSATILQAYREIAQTSSDNIPISLRVPLVIAALALFFVEYGLASTKFRTLP